MTSRCAICDNIIGAYRGNLFCGKCYKKWKEEILGKASWIQSIKNFETRRRRQEIRDDRACFIRFGDEYDVNTEGSLMRIGGYLKND